MGLLNLLHTVHYHFISNTIGFIISMAMSKRRSLKLDCKTLNIHVKNHKVWANVKMITVVIIVPCQMLMNVLDN